MIRKYVSAAFILLLVIATGRAQPSAAPDANATLLRSDLPQCVHAARDIAEIHRVQKANAKTSHKYDGYRKILHATPSPEFAARLAYAETIAANCPQQEDAIVDLIASVIGNRIRIRRGDVGSVVFQRDQFASSLNIYSESRYRDFLCPTDANLWNRVFAKMRTNLEQSTPTAPIPTDSVNYYLYRHSDRFEAPDWKLEEVRVADSGTRECIRVFRNSAWK